jgi:hypothetical protein
VSGWRTLKNMKIYNVENVPRVKMISNETTEVIVGE